VRLFVAIHLDDAVRDDIRGAIARFPVADPPWRWADAATWHVTLKFLGETAPADVDRVTAALAAVAPRHAAFDAALGAPGAFPNLRAPRVLFFSVADGGEAAAAIARDVDHALHDAVGLERERRPFHAHVTIARIKARLPADVASRLADAPPLPRRVFRVASFELMESRLGRSGATYSVVRRFPLV
jgi:2'-5' RNA ligase